MSYFVPTKEQRAAAATKTFGDWRTFRSDSIHRWVETGLVADDHTGIDLMGADSLADLLAEREHKLIGALKKAALRNPEDGPCFCVVPIPADTAHHLSCQHIRAVLAEAQGGV